MERAVASLTCEPAMADFELVHKDFLESFRRYRETLRRTAASRAITTGHPILGAIAKDNLFSEGLRSRIWVLAKLRDDPAIGSFMLDGVTSQPRRGRRRCSSPGCRFQNRYKTTLEAILESNEPEAEKRRKAVEALDDAVQSLQTCYSNVVGETSQ